MDSYLHKRSKDFKPIYVYVDWTTEATARPFYVGIGNDGRRRSFKRNPKHSATKKKYGIRRQILEVVAERDVACLLEQLSIKHFDTFIDDNSFGCNFTRGGEENSGHCAQTLAHIADRVRQQHRQPGYSARLGAKHRGYKHTEETLIRMRTSRRRRPPPSQVTIEKTRASNTGKKRSPTARQNISRAVRGKSESMRARYRMAQWRARWHRLIDRDFFPSVINWQDFV